MKNNPKPPFRAHALATWTKNLTRCGKHPRRLVIAASPEKTTCPKCRSALIDEVAQQLEKP